MGGGRTAFAPGLPTLPPEQDPGRAQTTALQTALESGTAVRLDAQLPLARHPMGIPHRKLPRLCPPCVPTHAAQALMRPPLETRDHFDRTIQANPRGCRGCGTLRAQVG